MLHFILIGILLGFALHIFLFEWLIRDIYYSMYMLFIDFFTRQTLFNVSEEHIEVKYVLPIDIDRNKHMNNSRYIYYLNFSRRLLFRSNGLWAFMEKHCLNCVVQSQTIRYRKEMKLWSKYKIKSKILSYSNAAECVYIESVFEDESNFICAVHHCKYRIVKLKGYLSDVNLTQPSNLFYHSGLLSTSTGLGKATSMYDDISSSSINNADSKDENHPEFLKYWIQSQEIHSKMMNPNKSK